MWRRHSIVGTMVMVMAILAAPAGAEEGRKTISLDGVWQIAEGSMVQAPKVFDRQAPVPGLVDMAKPAFVDPGPPVADRKQVRQKDPRRDAFWYRRTFSVDGPIPAVATLKVAKAMFGTRAILNGNLLGDHRPCFTPGYFDARDALRAGENELLIRVGADRDAVTAAVPSGFDYEKERYIPGIFDSVELILSGTPHIVSVQTAPDIANQAVRVQIRLRNAGKETRPRMQCVVREAKSGRLVGKAAADAPPLAGGAEQTADIRVRIAPCRLWSPEDPFLYTLSVDSGADCVQTRFGMREFTTDPATGRAMLNGKPYFMRGSNITLYRFFEDPARGDLPWREEWVRLLHRRVKDMHWNCLRYCIGFPPEAWYRIADEEGILIQDEFPLWHGGPGWGTWPAELKREELAAEYKEWMRERWNHPCLAIWDASNETTSTETAPAIGQVRTMDLSHRPWDNSYTYPQEAGDFFESHPYHFQNPTFKLRDIAKASPVPQGNAIPNDGKHPVIINEYGWLWLNRDGTPTTLTAELYKNLLGLHSTTAQRRQLYARYTAAESEFWRSHRKAAAVMHFTALGYSRKDGQTSDHWLDVEKLTWEPEFYAYVRDSFAPVGLMIDFWGDECRGGSSLKAPLAVINDVDVVWQGPLVLRLTARWEDHRRGNPGGEGRGLGSRGVCLRVGHTRGGGQLSTCGRDPRHGRHACPQPAGLPRLGGERTNGPYIAGAHYVSDGCRCAGGPGGREHRHRLAAVVQQARSRLGDGSPAHRQWPARRDDLRRRRARAHPVQRIQPLDRRRE